MICDLPPARILSASKVKAGFTLVELLVVIGILVILAALLVPATRSARPAAFRSHCTNNLKQIALGLHNYQDVYHALPPAYTVDANGKPLHSWRTLILPFVEQKPLYDTIDLSKPWDDPANSEPFKAVVPVYVCPGAKYPPAYTTYVAILAKNSCLQPTEPRVLSEIAKQHAKTLLVIEVDATHAVHWMSPVDGDEDLLASIGPKDVLAHSGGFNAVFVDGSVHFLSVDIPPAERRALVSIVATDP